MSMRGISSIDVQVPVCVSRNAFSDLGAKRQCSRSLLLRSASIVMNQASV